MAISTATLSSVLGHLRKWLSAWTSSRQEEEDSTLVSIVFVALVEKSMCVCVCVSILCCTGHIFERTFQPAGASSLLQNRERCSGSPPVWLQDLVNTRTHARSQSVRLSIEELRL